MHLGNALARRTPPLFPLHNQIWSEGCVKGIWECGTCIYYVYIYDTWYDMRDDMIWDMIDMIWDMIWHNMTWHDMGYDMTWGEMWYDKIWCDMRYDVRYDISWYVYFVDYMYMVYPTNFSKWNLWKRSWSLLSGSRSAFRNVDGLTPFLEMEIPVASPSSQCLVWEKD